MVHPGAVGVVGGGGRTRVRSGAVRGDGRGGATMGGVVNENLTGLVLAGGAGRRMGADKALIEMHGRPLIVHVATRLATVCASVLVAPGARPLPDLPWTQVDDRVPGEGPLAGILGGLAVATTELVAVVGVDMPGFRPDVLATLAQRWHDEPAVVPVIGGRLQPLHAVYAVAALPRLAALFDAGERSPTRALKRTGAALREMPEPAPWATSLNNADDLARFLER